jgi:hypothetical protein
MRRRARAHYRATLEALEARAARALKKMKTKSHLLCPWVLDIAEDPHILDIFEDLIGPEHPLLEHGLAREEGRRPDVRGLASRTRPTARRCRRARRARAVDLRREAGLPARNPGSHKWGVLKHEEKRRPESILARGQYHRRAVRRVQGRRLRARAGEMVMFDNSIVHGSAPNEGPDRRILLLVEMVPTWPTCEFRESAMLVRVSRRLRQFRTEEPRPDGDAHRAPRSRNW